MRVDLYLLLDFQTLIKKGWSFERFIEKSKQYSVKYIQYRDKINPNCIQIENLKKLKKLTSTPIIINDKIDLVLYCDGLHVGQEDIYNINEDKKTAVKIIRNIIKDKLLGLSTHNEQEVIEANNLELDYIGLGAYRKTSTKDVSNILGQNLSSIAKLSTHPVGAIGGVKIDDVISNISFNVVGSDFYEN